MNELGILFIAGAIAISAFCISSAYENTHKQMPTDPVAQRISAVNHGYPEDYAKMVKDIIEHSKKDTVYRDTCGTKK